MTTTPERLSDEEIQFYADMRVIDDDAYRMARELVERRAQEAWRPINDEARDGKRWLICGPAYGYGPEKWVTEGEYREGAFFTWPEDDDERRPCYEPTHFRPLPPPPQGAE